MRGSPPPELSNNPFLEHSSNALTRFPVVDDLTSPADSEFTSWIGRSNGIPQQQRYNTYSPQLVQQQPTAGFELPPTYQVQGLGLPSPQPPGGGSRFRPSSSFGLHLSNAMDTGGLGHLQGGGYPQQPQQQLFGMSNTGPVQVPPLAYQPTSPTYLSEFDPYSAIGQGSWDGEQGKQQQQPQQKLQSQKHQGGGMTKGGTPNSQPNPHPRELIPKYKAELEAWDSYSWKQLTNSLESLKSAWEERRNELDEGVKVISKHPGVVAQSELSQYKRMRDDADNSFSSVAASLYQLKEVLDGYRQSTDPASKRRVREAMNAALRDLPDYPYNP